MTDGKEHEPYAPEVRWGVNGSMLMLLCGLELLQHQVGEAIKRFHDGRHPHEVADLLSGVPGAAYLLEEQFRAMPNETVDVLDEQTGPSEEAS